MKQTLLLTLTLCMAVQTGWSQNNAATIAYITQFKAIAMKEMKRTGVPASITLAQAIVESNSGESNLAKKHNNHFGIKCKSDWTGAKAYQDDDSKQECFRAYEAAELFCDQPVWMAIHKVNVRSRVCFILFFSN